VDGPGQQQSAEPVCRRQREHDFDDLDRTLSTITEEGPDELARKMSEVDDELANAELTSRQQVLDDDNRASGSSDNDDEANDYSYYDVSLDAASW